MPDLVPVLRHMDQSPFYMNKPGSKVRADQCPLHRNESGSKGYRTISVKNAVKVPLLEGHAGIVQVSDTDLHLPLKRMLRIFEVVPRRRDIH